MSEQMNEHTEEHIEENQGESKAESKADSKAAAIAAPVKVWKIIITLVMLLVFTFFTAAVFWALGSWSYLEMDELLWHLKSSMKDANPDMIKSFVLIVGGAAFLATATGAFFMFNNRKKPGKGRLVYRITTLAATAILLIGLVSAFLGFNVGPFLKGYMTVSTFVEDHYVDPGSVKLTFPEKKRNLVYIYIESMETTFMDEENGGAFPKNVIPELTTLAKENEDFSGDSGVRNGGISLPGTIWTMGAIFGTTSGLPLKTPLGQNGMSASDDFFPGVITMGDILKKEGYRNRLLMGSASDFGGCALYYQSHGDFEIHDLYYARKVGRIPKDYFEFWGYEDRKLFEYAREEALELAAGAEPFQLVLQTMDTHFEDGYVCPECTKEFKGNIYANVMKCESRQVTEFVRWLQQQDFYENTTIIITGDHPTMDKNFTKDVPESYQRKTYTCIINPADAADTANKGNEKRVFSTMDLFPTALAALGVTIEGDRLGLGTNLYSDQKTLTEQMELSQLEEELNARSVMLGDMYGGTYVSPGIGTYKDDK